MLIFLVAVNHMPEKDSLDLKLCLQFLSGSSVYDVKQRLKTYQQLVILQNGTNLKQFNI